MDDMEDTEYVTSEHDRLVSAISKLDKTQHILEPTRSEPTNIHSEFNLVKRTSKLNINNIAKVLENTSNHTHISKKLKKTHNESKVLSKPLEKPQAERIKRATGYEETKRRVGRWDPVVARSRTVNCVSFPLKHVSTKLQPTGEFLSKFILKSELEKELEEVDPPPEVEDDDEEEEQLFPMTYEEMVEHRQHLAKMRAQQSYKAAKAKRQSKIKSKKYHRVLKKEKLKQQLKEFEELQKKDPEEALKKLEAIEKARALERHTLRHKNTGKWAKNKLIRAKYDKEVRQQIAEQLAVSRTLTQKVQDNRSSDDESDHEMIPDITLAQDPMNPWMMKRPDKTNINSEFDFGYKKFIQNKNIKKVDSDSDSGEDNIEHDTNANISILKASISKLSKGENFNETSEIDNVGIINKDQAPLANKDLLKVSKKETRQNLEANLTESKSKKIVMVKQSKAQLPVATSKWVVEPVNNNTAEEISSAFDNHEISVEKRVERKLKEIRQSIEQLEHASRLEKKKDKKKSLENKEEDNLENLKLKTKKVKAIIDEELIETTSKIVDEKIKNLASEIPSAKILSFIPPVQDTTDSNIDPTRFIEVKPKYLNTAISQVENEYDQLDDNDEQVVPKVNIEEVFEEDDVVASFRQEKEDAINKDKPEDINLSLPGWGSWGGKGVKIQKRKRNRFIAKLPPEMPRRDENKGDVIIREYKDPKLAAHKVKDVPFPFESVKDYEASIRAPLGNMFIPEKAHKKLIQPSVVTKAGTIIEPMDEEELLVPRNRSFKNKAIIKLLGQK